jgi:low temperature requirement protein LtrA
LTQICYHPSRRSSFVWGYGHLFIFAAAAAVGAGLAVAVDYATHHAAIGELGAGSAITAPVAVFLVGLWALQPPPRARHTYLLPLAALLVLLTSFSGQAALLTGLVLVGLITVKIVRIGR